MTQNVEKVRKGSLLLAAGLAGLLLVWVILAPAETRLGNMVKLIYVHGALVWVGLVTFSVAGGLGVVALVMQHLLGWTDRARTWYHGTGAGGRAALIVWIAYALSAMIVTGLAWGQVIAWNEPRVRVTGLILVAACGTGHDSRTVGGSQRFHGRGQHGDGHRALDRRSTGRGHPPSGGSHRRVPSRRLFRYTICSLC